MQPPCLRRCDGVLVSSTITVTGQSHLAKSFRSLTWPQTIRVISGTRFDVEKPVEDAWKGNYEGNHWFATEELVARTLERYNLIGMKLADVTKLMGDGNKDYGTETLAREEFARGVHLLFRQVAWVVHLSN